MTLEPSEIGRQAVRGSLYRVSSSGVTLGLGLLRAVLLARLLLPEDFGVAAMALFFVGSSAQLRALGTGSALVHRKEIDDRVVSTYFSLHLSLLAGSLALLAALTPLLARLYAHMPLLGVVLLSLIAVELFRGLNQVPESLLARNLAFRRLAFTDTVSSIIMTVVAPALAWYGAGVFSLVGEQASGALTRFVLLWGFSRPLRPRPGWDREIARWFWRYGISVWKATKLQFLTERFDDFWVGTTLGGASLGLYSRAYEFAQYPRRVVANPLLSVFFPVFARLQEDRLQLSRAFFRVTALMVRAGFGFSLLFIATAPELIHLLLGERWIAMTLPFQLMIVYALLDPLKLGVESLLSAVGRPDIHARIALAQAVFFVPAVVLLSLWGGIVGVALAADGMMLLGGVLLFRKAPSFVDFSTPALWLWPAVCLMTTGAAIVLLEPWVSSASILTALLVKAGLVIALYGGLLFLVEHAEMARALKMVRELVRHTPEATPGAAVGGAP